VPVLEKRFDAPRFVFGVLPYQNLDRAGVCFLAGGIDHLRETPGQIVNHGAGKGDNLGPAAMVLPQ